MESTIFESFILPSKGLVYDNPIDPNVTLRSMTTFEEMKRLSPTDTPYKVMCDIIEACMKEPPAIHVYDMCLGDYQFLLHKLRIVTYGPEYKMLVQCGECGATTDSIADLESLELNEYDESIIEKKKITLPKTGHEIELRLQTPRDIDMIAYKTKEKRKRTKQNADYSILFTLVSLINTIDGARLSSSDLEDFVTQLPVKDTNYILNKSAELSKMIGLNTTIKVKCSECGKEMEVPFRITSEFFGPTND